MIPENPYTAEFAGFSPRQRNSEFRRIFHNLPAGRGYRGYMTILYGGFAQIAAEGSEEFNNNPSTKGDIAFLEEANKRTDDFPATLEGRRVRALLGFAELGSFGRDLLFDMFAESYGAGIDRTNIALEPLRPFMPEIGDGIFSKTSARLIGLAWWEQQSTYYQLVRDEARIPGKEAEGLSQAFFDSHPIWVSSSSIAEQFYQDLTEYVGVESV